MSQGTDTLLMRFDRLSVWPYRYYVLLAIGAGFFFSFFDELIIGLALPEIKKQFLLSSQEAASTISIGLTGYVIGAFAVARLSDYIGRRIAMFISIAFFTVGSLGCGLSDNFTTLLSARFCSGLGTGAEVAVVTTLICELSPTGCRGKYMSVATAFGMLGFAIVPFVAMAIIPSVSWGWRAMFFIGSAGSIVIAIVRLWVPESPRWLLIKGRDAEANTILQQAFDLIKKRGISLPSALPAIPMMASLPTSSGITLLLQRAYWPYLLLFTVIWMAYYLGNFAWLTVGTTLFVDKGFGLTQSLSYIAISSLGFLVGTLVPIALGDKFERKWVAASILLIWMIALLLIGWWPTKMMIIVAGFIASASIAAVIPVLYTYTAEHFPTTARTTGIAITDGLGHIGGAMSGPIILGVFTYFNSASLGFAAAFSVMAFSSVIAIAGVLAGKRMNKRSI